MKKVFISTTTFAEDDRSVLDILVKEGFAVTMNPHHRRLSESEIAEFLFKGEYAGLLAGLEPLTEDVLAKSKNLKVISRVGIGLDNIDRDAAYKYGIKIFNTPGVLTDAVAELTLGLVLDALRKITFCDRQMREGHWNKKMGVLLKGKTFGIIGLGHIGGRVAELAMAFGAKVIFSDIRKIKQSKARQVTLPQLIKSSDIITFHTSGHECLIGEQEIQAAKRGVIIVNTARGSLINETALLKGLSSGKIACAALDVFDQEPYQGELCKNEHVILTPHIGSYAREARMVMEKRAVRNLIAGLKKKEA